MLKKIINPFIIFVVLAGACYEVGKTVEMPMLFFDFPSLIIVLIIATAYSFSNQANKLIEFGNGAVYAGWLAFLIGLIGMSIEFANTNIDFKGLMEANSVLCLGVFYGYSIKLVLTTYKN
tara:strand:- start:51 stop:410 length:360 start_codon:yes stop_codon:yes gene_type:complete